MTNAEIADLAQHVLDTHHARLRAELPPIVDELVIHRAAPELLRPIVGLQRLIEEHLMKEEHIIFPRLLALRDQPEGAALGLEAPIRGMHREHDLIRDLEHEIRAALPHAGAHAEALGALLDDLAVHAQLEDERLFADALARDGVPEAERLPAPWSPAPARGAPAAKPSPRPTASPGPSPSPAPPGRGGLRARLKGLLGRS